MDSASEEYGDLDTTVAPMCTHGVSRHNSKRWDVFEMGEVESSTHISKRSFNELQVRGLEAVT